MADETQGVDMEEFGAALEAQPVKDAPEPEETGETTADSAPVPEPDEVEGDLVTDADLQYAGEKAGRELTADEQKEVRRHLTRLRQKDSDERRELEARAKQADVFNELFKDPDWREMTTRKLLGEDAPAKAESAPKKPLEIKYETEEDLQRLLKEDYPKHLQDALTPTLQKMVEEGVRKALEPIQRERGENVKAIAFSKLSEKFGADFVASKKALIEDALQATRLDRVKADSAEKLFEGLLWQVAGPDLAKRMLSAQAPEKEKLEEARRATTPMGTKRRVESDGTQAILDRLYEARKKGDYRAQHRLQGELDEAVGDVMLSLKPE